MILKKRFRKKQLLAINKHVDINLNIDLVSSIFDVKSLRSLYDTVESDIRPSSLERPADDGKPAQH